MRPSPHRDLHRVNSIADFYILFYFKYLNNTTPIFCFKILCVSVNVKTNFFSAHQKTQNKLFYFQIQLQLLYLMHQYKNLTPFPSIMINHPHVTKSLLIETKMISPNQLKLVITQSYHYWLFFATLLPTPTRNTNT